MLAGVFQHVVTHLVGIGHHVDEPRVERLLTEERAAIEHPRDLLRVELSSFGDAAHQLREMRAHHRFHRFAEVLVVGAVGVEVHCVLELHPLAHEWCDLELVQEPAHEGALVDQTGQSDVTRRLQVDPLEGAGQVIPAIARAELAEGLREGERRFARRAETADRVADFLQVGHAHPAPADSRDECLDARVPGGPGDGGHHVAQRQQVVHHELGQGIRRNGLDDSLLEIHLHHQTGSQPLLSHDGQQTQRGETADSDDGEESDERQDRHDRFFHGFLPNPVTTPER